jgi:hypothetical protein
MTVPELIRVLGTRAALGIGLRLLLANAFSSAEKRSAVGWTLLAAGALMGASIGYEIFGRPRPFTLAFGTEGDGRGDRPESQGRQRPQEALAPQI